MGAVSPNHILHSPNSSFFAYVSIANRICAASFSWSETERKELEVICRLQNCNKPIIVIDKKQWPLLPFFIHSSLSVRHVKNRLCIVIILPKNSNGKSDTSWISSSSLQCEKIFAEEFN